MEEIDRKYFQQMLANLMASQENQGAIQPIYGLAIRASEMQLDDLTIDNLTNLIEHRRRLCRHYLQSNTHPRIANQHCLKLERE